MRIPNLEHVLKELLNIMVKHYNWLTIKFEYNEEKNRYLVSYSPKDKIQNDDEFMKESMMLEDWLVELYGNYAPLFCDEEELFKLSPNAQIIKYESK